MIRPGYLRIAVIYFLLSIIWITLSDKAIYLFDKQLSPETILLIGSSKGYLFVIITAILLSRLIKANEAKYIESEHQYRSMYEGNLTPQFIFDPATFRFVSVNRAAVEKYGYTEEEFLNKTIFDIRPAEDRDKVLKLAQSVTPNFGHCGTWRHLKKDGTLLFANICLQKVQFNGKPHVLVMAQDITDNLKLEQQLEELNQELLEEKRKLSETQRIAKVGGWELFVESKKLIWSEEIYKMAESDADRDAFELYLSFLHPDDRPMMIEALDRLINTGQNLDVTHRVIFRDGSLGYIHQIGRLEYKNGKPYKVIGALQDVTEFKQLELEKNKYVYTLEDTLKSMSESFYALNKDLVITKVNRKFEIDTGFKAEEIVGRPIIEVFPGLEKRELYFQLLKVLKERTSVKLETYSRTLKQWIHVAAYPTAEGVAAYFIDITDQKQKDLRLKEAVKRYELVAKATQDVIYEYNLEAKKVSYNTSLWQLIYVRPEEVGEHIDWWRALIHPEDLQKVELSQQEVIRQKQANWAVEYRVRVSGNQYKYVYDQGYFLYDEQGKPIKLIGAVKDIDALKKANGENRRLAEIITKVNNMIVVMDTEHRITWVNKAFEDYCGYPAEMLIGHFPMDFLQGPETRDETMAYIFEAKKRRETFSVELVHYVRYEKRWVNIEYTPLFDDCGQYSGYIAVHQDITMRKQRSEQIRSQNEVLQRIAWLSSHKVRKPVANILGLGNLASAASCPKEKDELIGLINDCALQLDGIVSEITQKVELEIQ